MVERDEENLVLYRCIVGKFLRIVEFWLWRVVDLYSWLGGWMVVFKLMCYKGVKEFV